MLTGTDSKLQTIEPSAQVISTIASNELMAKLEDEITHPFTSPPLHSTSFAVIMLDDGSTEVITLKELEKRDKRKRALDDAYHKVIFDEQMSGNSRLSSYNDCPEERETKRLCKLVDEGLLTDEIADESWMELQHDSSDFDEIPAETIVSDIMAHLVNMTLAKIMVYESERDDDNEWED